MLQTWSCFLTHTKYISSSIALLNHHQCAASTWMMWQLPQNNGASALTTHQLQVERRESHRANQVYALTTHQLQVERRERVIEPIKCMLSPHTSYRWRGERVKEPIKWMGIIRRLIDTCQWWEFGQDTGVTPILFTRIAMGFLMTTESQDLGLTSHPE